MDLAASRSARRQNKLVMRLGCVLVAVGFLVSSVVTPRAQAVAVVDDVAVGAMSCAAFLESIGLPLSATGGAGAVSGGITAVAGEYAAATGAAASGEAVLGGIAAGTMISTAGTIILSAAAVAACAALAYWLVNTYLVDEEIGTVVDFPLSYIYSSNGYRVIFSSNVDLPHTFLDYFIPFNTLVIFDTGYSIRTYISDVIVESSGLPKVAIDIFRPDGTIVTYYMAKPMFYDGPNFSYFGWMITASSDGNDRFFINQVWANVSTGSDGSPVYIIGSRGPETFSGLGDIIGVSSASKLSASLSSDFNIPEIQPDQQMEIAIPSAAPGSTLSELVETVPQQVADGTLTATYEIAVDSGAFGETSTPDYDDLEDVDDLGLPSLGEALTKRFPFSIPWDIARGITLLAAPAKTPHFEVDFYAPISNRVGGWKGSTKLVLDFSQFESLGRLSRWTSTIGFCLFLASATKRFIWTA